MNLSRPTKMISGLLLALSFLLMATAATAQAAAPAWSLHITHSPTPFERLQEHGEYPVQYTVSVENSGDEATTGSYSLTDTPPPQLAVEHVTAGAGWSCTTTAQVIAGAPLSCTSEVALEPGASAIAVTVLMAMSPSAPDTVTDEATISGGGNASAASASDPTPVIDRQAFNVEGFTAPITDAGGDDYPVAGGHPFSTSASFSLPTYHLAPSAEVPAGITEPVEDLKDAFVELPPGFLGNPAATPRCPSKGIEGFFLNCPASTIVGSAEIEESIETQKSPIYNVVPERGYPAEFVFKAGPGLSISLFPVLRPRTGSYGVTVESINADILQVLAVRTTFYGVPSAQNGTGGAEIPLLSNPVNCSDGRPETKIAIDSWVHPGGKLPGELPDLRNPAWKTATALAPPLSECGSQALSSQFHPTLTTGLSQEGGALQADHPSGLDVGLDFPQSNDPTDPHTVFDPTTPQAPELKNITVALPAGLSISPSSADGLGACSDLASDPSGDQIHYENTKPVSCPDASKIGSVTATSPLLAAHDPITDTVTGSEPIHGDLYVLKPHAGDLPPGGAQNGTFRLLIQLESAQNGINVKLPGTVTADKATGQLTATFTENPQLPVKHVQISLKSGPRAPLSSPSTCGTFTTTSELVPWSTPGTPDANPSSSFSVTSGPNGMPCAGSPGARPFSPSLTAGNRSTAAGSASPFTLDVSRGDGEQELHSIDLSMPKGFTAKLAGIPYCPEQAIAQAASESGAAEQASPSCPASQVGAVTVGAGPGTNPYYVSGKAYLAGPYEGAPLSLVFITPAVAGPFDLGNVVVRAAVYIDPNTAQVTVKSDQIPQILDGVPLQIRHISVDIDREGFVLNPTDCTPMTLSGTMSGGSEGAVSKSVSNLFQASNCANLKLQPKFEASITTSTGAPAAKVATAARSAKAKPAPAKPVSVFASKQNGIALHVKLTEPDASLGTQANLAKVKVELPKALPSRLTTLQKACTSEQFAANPAGCPAESIVGQAKVITPLLPVPLSGPAYFVSHGGEAFPSLTIVLQGYGITIDLVGTTFISKSGITSTTFKSVPDVPFSSFELTLPQGRYSALTGNGDLCKTKLYMPTEYAAQNGAQLKQRNPIAVAGCIKPKALTRTQKLAAALKACKKKPKAKRGACQRQAHKRYGAPKKQGKAKSKKGKKT
jgi:uncharacterized repeat protein (TIGR01451 family)